MMLKGTERSPWMVVRDPNWLFGPFQLLNCLGVLLYGVVGPMCVRLGIRAIWFVILLLLAAVGALAFRCYEYFLDRSARAAQQGESACRDGVASALVGRPAEIQRVRAYATACPSQGRVFRTGLRADQHCILLVMVFVVLPFLGLFVGVSLTTIWLICVSVAGAMILQTAYTRVRYRVLPGALVVEELCWLWDVGSRTLPLNEAKFRCNFAEGNMEIALPMGVVPIGAVEMFSPHRFAACMLAATGEMESVCATRPAPVEY